MNKQKLFLFFVVVIFAALGFIYSDKNMGEVRGDSEIRVIKTNIITQDEINIIKSDLVNFQKNIELSSSSELDILEKDLTDLQREIF